MNDRKKQTMQKAKRESIPVRKTMYAKALTWEGVWCVEDDRSLE